MKIVVHLNSDGSYLAFPLEGLDVLPQYYGRNPVNVVDVEFPYLHGKCVKEIPIAKFIETICEIDGGNSPSLGNLIVRIASAAYNAGVEHGVYKERTGSTNQTSVEKMKQSLAPQQVS